jgi:hypothetical protein
MTTATFERSGFGFQPGTEASYIARLAPERRRTVLVAEVSTAVGEANRFSFRQQYQWKDGQIIDPRSGEALRVVLQNGQRPEETEALKTIETGLREDRNLVVNFSPANPELRYPKGVVDVWERKGSRVTWSRATTENTFGEMRDVYRQLSGVEVANEREMLSRPIVRRGMRSKEVLVKLNLTEEKTKISQAQINKLVEVIVDDFSTKFGESFLINADQIFRTYTAAMMEVERWIEAGVTNVIEEIKVGWRELRDYAFRPMVARVVDTFGCDFKTTIGGFLNRVKSGAKDLLDRAGAFFGRRKYFECPRCEGKIPKGKGIETCPHCGARKSDFASKCD